MSRPSNGERLKRQRVWLFINQAGKCHWCQRDMILVFKWPPGVPQPDNLCTLEHLNDRNQGPRPQAHFTHVVACRKCNNERGAASQAALGIEELRRRAGRGTIVCEAAE